MRETGGALGWTQILHIILAAGSCIRSNCISLIVFPSRFTHHASRITFHTSLVPERRLHTPARLPPAWVTQHRLGLLANDLLAAEDFLLTLFKIIVSDGLQVVDVVEVNVLQEVHLGLDVARHS